MFTRYQMYKHKHTQSRTPLHSKTFFLLFYTYKKKEEEEVNIIVIFSKESILIILQVRFIYSLTPQISTCFWECSTAYVRDQFLYFAPYLNVVYWEATTTFETLLSTQNYLNNNLWWCKWCRSYLSHCKSIFLTTIDAIIEHYWKHFQSCRINIGKKSSPPTCKFKYRREKYESETNGAEYINIYISAEYNRSLLSWAFLYDSLMIYNKTSLYNYLWNHQYLREYLDEQCKVNVTQS